MNKAQLKQLSDKVLHLAMAEHFDAADALALAAVVLDHLVGAMPEQTTDRIIDKGILLHAMRQLDMQHGVACNLLRQP